LERDVDASLPVTSIHHADMLTGECCWPPT
jgi:hypothetical protein